MQNFKRKNRGKDMTGNDRAIRRLRKQCERAKYTLFSFTQTTVEIDSLLASIDYSSFLSRACFEEFCMEYFGNERDSGFDKKSVQDVVLVGGSIRNPKVQSMIQEFLTARSQAGSLTLIRLSIWCRCAGGNPHRRKPFSDAGPATLGCKSTVHGLGNSW
jgi:heat shock protein 1/8